MQVAVVISSIARPLSIVSCTRVDDGVVWPVYCLVAGRGSALPNAKLLVFHVSEALGVGAWSRVWRNL